MCPHVPHLLCPPLCCCSEDPEQRRFNEWELRELEDREDWEEDVPAVSCWFVQHLAPPRFCVHASCFCGAVVGQREERQKCCWAGGLLPPPPLHSLHSLHLCMHELHRA